MTAKTHVRLAHAQRLKHLATTRQLCAAFGVTPYAYDPGVIGYATLPTTGQVARLDFGAAEWAWLMPLLEELREYRARY